MQMAEVEKQYVDTSQRLRKEFESKLVEVRRAGEEDVHLRMNAGTKRVMQHNRSLQEELRIHIEVGVAAAMCCHATNLWLMCCFIFLEVAIDCNTVTLSLFSHVGTFAAMMESVPTTA